MEVSTLDKNLIGQNYDDASVNKPKSTIHQARMSQNSLAIAKGV
jgi:hypothetical protein